MRIRSVLAAAAIVATTVATAAEATVTISLTGDIADFTQSQLSWGGLLFDEYYMPLSGLDATNAFTVDVGDTIDATVTLDQAFTMPASLVRTDFLLYLTGSSFPAGETGVHGTIALFNGSSQVFSTPYWSSTTGQLASFGAFFPPDNAAYTFDSFTVETTIDKLDAPGIIDHAGFEYALVSNVGAVPEPSVWAMLLVGFGMIGLALRLKDRRAVATA
jgi:hypothetical protein